MNETIRKHLAERKWSVLALVALVVIGAVFLIMGRFGREPEEYFHDIFYGDTTPQEIENTTRENFSYEQAIERRLEEFFSMVEGAGQVRVMVSPLGGRETVFAMDVNGSRSYASEQDSQGGSRETRNYQSQEKIVIITNRQGTDIPLVIREIEPRIEGIVIIAEGGDSPFVRDALTRAARAMLGLDAHMIQVLTMQN